MTTFSTYATATYATGNIVVVQSAENMIPGLPITFLGNTFGNVTANATYYIGNISFGYPTSNITITSLPGGAIYPVGDGSGSMVASFSQGGQQIIPTTPPGEPLNQAFDAINLNFDQIFAAGPVGSNIQIDENTIYTLNTNGNLVLNPNGIGNVVANAHVVPDQDRVRNLGASLLRWNTVYAQQFVGNISGNIVAGGSNGQIQYNNNGILAGANGFTFLANTSSISLVGTINAGNVLTPGIVSSAGGVYGDIYTTMIESGDSSAILILSEVNLLSDLIVGQSLQVDQNISATGNITGGNVLFGSGVVSGTGNIYANKIFANIQGNIDAAGNLYEVQFNTTGDQLGASANFAYNFANNVLTVSNGNIVSGNVLSGNVLAGTVSTTGNISANYYFGNGSQLTGITADNVNADDLVGNILSANVLYSNLVTVGNLVSLSVIGNTTTGNLSTAGAISATGNITGGNVLFGSGIVSGTGNIYAGNIFANISGNIDAAGNLYEVQFNTTGDQLGANTNFTYDFANNIFTVANGNIVSGNVLASTVSATGNVYGNWFVGNVDATVISATGNVTANYFFGNGSQLTGIDATSIQNGNSNVRVAANANVTVGVSGVSNVAVFTLNGLDIAGNVSATGNVSASNFFFGAGTVSGTGNIYAGNIFANISGNIDAAGNLYEIQFNTTGGLLGANSNFTYDSANNVFTVNNGNVTGGNILTSGRVSASANVYGSWFVGNVDAETVTATANITGGNILTAGEVSATGSGTFGNVLTGGTVSATSTIQGGNILTPGEVSAGGSLTGGNVFTGGIVSATSTVTGGNIATAGSVSATGTVTGGNLITAGFVSATGEILGGNISTTGNVTASNVNATTGFFGNINLTGDITVNSLTSNTFVSASGNVVGANIITTGLISAQGNVSGNYFIGNGAFLTGIDTTLISNGNTNVQTYANGNVAVTVAGVANTVVFTVAGTDITGNATITGNVSGGNIFTAGQISAAGNITGANVNTTNIYSASDLFLNPTGNVVLDGGKYINNVNNPQQAQDAATKQYVDDAVSTGIHIHTPVYLETPVSLPSATYAQGGNTYTVNQTIAGNTVVFSTAANLQPNDQLWFSNSFEGIIGNTAYFVVSTPNTSAAVLSAAYNGVPVSNITSNTGLTETVRVNSGVGATLTGTANGALTVDSVAVSTTNRILVYQQANAVENGVYVVSQTGNATTPFILTRSSDTDRYVPDDNTGLDQGSYFYVQAGATGAGESYVMTGPAGSFVIGYSNIEFTQFSASQVYSANTAAGLSLTGTVFSAKVDNNTTAFDGGGNIIVKAGANLTTPNIGDATGSSLSVSGNVTGGNITTPGYVTATGNVTGANIVTAGNITATGNITGNYFIGNGSQLSGVTATSVDAGNLTGNTLSSNVLFSSLTTVGILTSLSVSGNIDGGNIATAGVVTAAGTVTGGNLATAGTVTATGNITGGNVLTSGAVSATANVTSGNLVTGGIITATGTLYSGNVLTPGEVSAGGSLTGGNIFTGGQISAVSTITGGNIATAGYVTATGNITGGNIVSAGQISATGNITAPIFLGNLEGTTASLSGNVIGSNLFTSGVVSATSNITGGNLLTGGQISATANITGGNILFGSGIVSGTGNIYAGNIFANITGNIDAAGANTEIQFNDNGILGASPGFTFNTVGNTLTANGNINGANLFTGGQISATGNISSGANISGNFVSPGANREMLFNDNGLINSNAGLTFDKAGPTLSLTNAAGTVITGFVSSLGGSDLALTPATSNLVIWANTNPRFSNTYQLGTSTFQWKNVWAGNANVGTLGVGNLSTSGNITGGANILATGYVSAAGNVTGTNIITSGSVTATGNITGGNILFGSGIVSGTGNIYANNIFANISGNIDAAGNINEIQFNGTGDILAASAGFTFDPAANVLTANGNINGANLFTGGIVSAVGSVTGGNIYTAGVVSATGDITGGNIVTVGQVSGGTLDITGNAVINGDLAVNGNIIYVNVTSFNVEDPIIGLGRGANDTPLTFNDGKDRGEQLWYFNTGANVEQSAFIGYDNSANKIIAAIDVTIANEIVTVNDYGTFEVGNLQAALLSAAGNITAGNLLTGGLVSATGNATAGNLITGGSVTAAGNITGGNILFGPGIVSGTGNIYADTIFANISGNIDAAGNLYEIQFNTTGDLLGANANFTYDFANNVFTVANGNIVGGNVLVNTDVSATGNITGNNVIVGNILIPSSGNVTVGNVNINNLAEPAANSDAATKFYVDSVAANVLPIISNQTISPDGISNTFVLNQTATDVGILLTINGITQTPTTNYTVTGNSLTMAETPLSSDIIQVRYLTGTQVGGGTNYANANVVAYGQSGWAGNIIPSGNAVYSLGNATNQWKDLYVSGNTIYIGNVPMTIASNVLSVAGNAVLTSNNTTNISTTGNITANYFVGNGSQLTGLPAGYGNSNVATFLAAYGSNTISTSGNITAGNFIGNISITGNVTGTSSNVTLVAGSYSYTFDNTGVATFPAVGGDEGGEINLGVPAANTTLQNSVKMDVYQDRLRFFEGSANAKGAYIDLANCANGVATAIGYRDIPQITFSANATAAINAAGCHYYSTTAGNLALTLPDNSSVAFPTGATLTIVVNAAGNVLVNQGTGVSLYQAGASTTGNRVVGAYGLATVMKVAANTWVISGTGVY